MTHNVQYRIPDAAERTQLAAFRGERCLTIYVPSTELGSNADANRITLKNHLRAAKTALIGAGASASEANRVLRPAYKLMQGHTFWAPRRDGLALFMHQDFFRACHLPANDTPQLLAVDSGFNLEPLEAVLRSNRAYLVLTLDHRDVRLYEGDRFFAREVQLKGMPADMEQTLRIDEYPSVRELHDVAPAYMGKGSEGYHSQYNVTEVDKTMLADFFRLLDRRLHRYLMSRRLPLILAGVDYLLPIYRGINTYPYVWPDAISGSMRRASPEIIRDRAWALIGAGGTGA